MDRNTFLKKGLLGTGMLVAAGATAKVLQNNIDELEPLTPQMADPNIGFNHLPLKSEDMEDNFIFHPASSRGGADHGWLKTRHTFSFAQYYNPERMHFGVLRVLNDDHILGGTGFGTHPHDRQGALLERFRGHRCLLVRGRSPAHPRLKCRHLRRPIPN